MRYVPRPRPLAPISTDQQRVKRALYLLKIRDSSAAQVVSALRTGNDPASAQATARRATRQLQQFEAEADGLVNLAARKRCLIAEVTPEDAMRLGPFVFNEETA